MCVCLSYKKEKKRVKGVALSTTVFPTNFASDLIVLRFRFMKPQTAPGVATAWHDMFLALFPRANERVRAYVLPACQCILFHFHTTAVLANFLVNPPAARESPPLGPVMVKPAGAYLRAILRLRRKRRFELK